MAAASTNEFDTVESPPSVALFGGMYPQHVLETVKLLCKNNDEGWEGKRVPASYKKWSKLNANQRKNILVLWNGFSDDYRTKIETMVKALDNPVEANLNTTKNDLIRLLHLREWPGAIAIWTRALGPMTRLALDANGSRVNEDDDNVVRMAPWEEIAGIFNCRTEQFQPQNMAVDYGDGGEKTRDPRGDHISPGVVDLLYDLDPNEENRPSRDGAWIKATWRRICKDVSLCFERFSASGSQNGDTTTLDGVNEWVFNFAAQFDQAVMYAGLICATNTLQTLGKLLPVGGEESGVLEEDAEDTPAAAKRKILQRSADRQRPRAERKARVDTSVAAKRKILQEAPPPHAPPLAEEDAVTVAMVWQTQGEMLMKLVDTLGADDQRKTLVVNRMLQLSGITIPPPPQAESE
jgi:hypothetical protein